MSPRARSVTVRIVIAVVVVAAVAVWLRSRGQAAERAAPHPGGSGAASGAQGAQGAGAGDRVVPVRVAAVVDQDVPIWLEGLGTVSAVQQVTVRSQVDGRLDQVLFTEGQAVKKGQVIAQVDPRPFLVQLHTAQGALARDQAQRKNAQTVLARNQGLHDQNLIAQQTVDDAAAQVGQADGAIAIDRAAVEAAQLQLDYAQIKSPIDGITGVRQVDAGNLVHAGDPGGIVIVTQLEPVAILFSVPQDQLAAIARAMAAGDVPVEAWSRDGRTRIGAGKAAVIDNQINQATATLRVKALVPNPARALWPNQFVKARMLLDTLHGARVVPTVAVQRGPQGAFVYVIGADQTAQMVPIEAGVTTADLTVVTKGLEAGAQVVIEGANQLRPGAKVDMAGDGAGRDSGTGRGTGKGTGRRP